MNSLSVIKEEIEEIMPEECSDILQKLKDDLALAINKIRLYEEKLLQLENNEQRFSDLMALCQEKNNEIHALERKVKDLTLRNDEKDKQIISMLSMEKDFKLLVECEHKTVQTDFGMATEIEKKLALTEEKNAKLKEVIISQIEEIQKLKSAEKEQVFSKKKNEGKAESKVRPGGYCPLFLRRPKG